MTRSGQSEDELLCQRRRDGCCLQHALAVALIREDMEGGARSDDMLASPQPEIKTLKTPFICEKLVPQHCFRASFVGLWHALIAKFLDSDRADRADCRLGDDDLQSLVRICGPCFVEGTEPRAQGVMPTRSESCTVIQRKVLNRSRLRPGPRCRTAVHCVVRKARIYTQTHPSQLDFHGSRWQVAGFAHVATLGQQVYFCSSSVISHLQPRPRTRHLPVELSDLGVQARGERLHRSWRLCCAAQSWRTSRRSKLWPLAITGPNTLSLSLGSRTSISLRSRRSVSVE